MPYLGRVQLNNAITNLCMMFSHEEFDKQKQRLFLHSFPYMVSLLCHIVC